MFEKLVFLAILALAQARPEGFNKWDHLELHEWCPPAEVHWLLPHEYDCTLFYYCEYGLKWINPRKCAKGTEFSYELQVCVHPEKAQCNLPGFPPTDAPEPAPTNAPSTAAPTAAPTTRPPTAAPVEVNSEESNEDKEVELLPNGCPADETIDLLLPHPNCGKFYQCVHGDLVEKRCRSGLHFNVAEQKCDWPEKAGCDGVSGGEDNESGSNSGEDNGNGGNSVEDSGDGDNSVEDGGNGGNGGGDSSNEVETLPNGCPADETVDQFFPHLNCNKFYQCVHGEKIAARCPAGLHFNFAAQKCDWPTNAGCEGVSGGENGGNGGEDNGNGGHSGEDHGNGGHSGEDHGNGGNSGENGGNGGEDDSNEVELLPNGCPASETIDQYFPHQNCNKFYQCVHGEKIVTRCQAGLHFNVAEQKCDWPENAGCEGFSGGENGGHSGEDNENGGHSGEDHGNGGHSGEDHGNGGHSGEDHGNGEHSGEDHGNGGHSGEDHGNGGHSGEDHGNGGHSGEDHGNGGHSGEDHGNGGHSGEDGGDSGGSEGGDGSNEVETLPNGCPADETIDQFFPHLNCNKFYQCVHGNKIVMRCPAGLHFNAAEQKCDWPTNAGCEGVSGGENGGNGGEDHGNGGHSGEDHGNGGHSGEDHGNGGHSGEDGGNAGGEGSNEVETLPNGCPADETIDQFFPHPNCNKFYQCVHGEKIAARCPADLHFNVAEQRCDWPSNAGCEAVSGENGGNSGENNGNGENSGDDNGNGGNSGEDGNNGGEDGGNGGEDHGNGENGGGNGDGGSLANGCPADFTVHQLLPHETNCGKFYYCVRGDLVERQCPSGTHFNPTLQVCDWPWNAGCEHSDGGNGGGGNGNGEHGNRCADGCNVRPWAHDNDCDKFWRCNGEVAHLVTCSEGLNFNAVTGTCDFASNVSC